MNKNLIHFSIKYVFCFNQFFALIEHYPYDVSAGDLKSFEGGSLVPESADWILTVSYWKVLSKPLYYPCHPSSLWLRAS